MWPTWADSFSFAVPPSHWASLSRFPAGVTAPGLDFQAYFVGVLSKLTLHSSEQK